MTPTGSSPTRAALQRSSNIKIGVGFLLAVAGQVLSVMGAGGAAAASSTAGQAGGGALGLVGVLLSLVGTVLFIWGCAEFAKSKGYSPWLGALGLIGCIGLLVLVVLPNKWVEPGFNPADGNSNYPR